LWRGDSAGGLSRPVPDADASLVRHILYLGGAGRSSPYHSTSEEHGLAERFAGKSGRVYETSVANAKKAGVGHVPQIELLRLLKGKGKGGAKWHSALEVMMARKYVEQWREHILNFAEVPEDADIDAILGLMYR
jgi:hypothetical protein